jgi:hypothetical protein
VREPVSQEIDALENFLVETQPKTIAGMAVKLGG